MMLTAQQKELLKRDLADCLRGEKEISKVVIFGSFLTSGSPNDLDVAVFQDSAEPYLPLALKYRKKTRPIARTIPVDIIPIRPYPKPGAMMDAIEQGEVVYER